MRNYFVFLGSINAFLAVSLGAFGAHGLKSHLSSAMFTVYQTGVQYHMSHALGLLAIGILMHFWSNTRSLHIAGWFLLGGIILFSGSLYVLSITGMRTLGIITPFGGIAFLIGWLVLAIAAWQNKDKG